MFLENASRKGWIEVVCGSMFSGKTEELIRRLKRAQFAHQRVEIFKPRIDVRYSEEEVVSHDANAIRSTPVESPQNILLMTSDVDVVGIDEAQFFDDSIVDVCRQLADSGVRVIVAGLDMDYTGKPFGPMPALMATAEYVTKVHAICVRCGNLAHHSHRLTSDVSTYDQLIYEYENRQEGEPLFLFGVTIQNHGGYEDENFQTTVRVKEAAGEYPQTEQYLSLTKKSDQALEYLLDYFSQREDPVVVLFFGDHWPNLEEEYLTDLLGTDSTSLGLEDMMREYQVPFVIWANYPLESQEIEAVSLNYLSGLLLRAAGLEGTDYTKFLEQLRQEVPVITAVGTMDKDGSLYAVGESTPYDSLLNDYAVLQYNNAFGGSGKVSSIFTR